MKMICLLISFFALTLEAHPFKRMIVFGDSLVDGGTYAAVAGPRGGGKFTINPGQTWVEGVATHLNLELTPNRHEGFGAPLEILGGSNYAQGGARVSETKPLNANQGSARSMKEQLQFFIDAHQSFKSDDLVVVAAGAIDVVFQVQMLTHQQITLNQAIANVDKAANDLDQLVKTIRKNGSPYVVVPALPAISKTPYAQTEGPEAVTLYARFVKQFNASVRKIHGFKVGVLRADLLDQAISKNPSAYGITNATTPACRMDLLPGGSALFCSDQTLVSADARTYKFSDDLHPTPLVHQIVADYVAKVLDRLF